MKYRSIKSKSGSAIPIDKAYLNPTAKPRGGWGIEYNINGNTFKSKGSTPALSVIDYVNVLKFSNVKFDLSIIWLEANLQWLKKTPERKHLVELSEVIRMLDVRKDPELPPKKGKRDYIPEDFGSKGWDAMTYELAQDDYSYSKFISLVKDHVLNWLDPIKNPSIGCGECHDHFSVEVNKLSRRYFGREESREWLYNVNSIVRVRLGKKPHDKEEFWNKALWK